MKMAYYSQILSVCLMILPTAFYAKTNKAADKILVSSGDHINLNCSIDTKLEKYTVFWEFLNMTGYRITKEIYADRNERNADTSYNIDQAQIYDIGKYNCTIHRITPPPSKNFSASLINLSVQAPPNMSLNSTIGDNDNVTAQCSLHEFYPKDVNVSLKTTCGNVQYLNDPLLTRNADGTYNAIHGFFVNIFNCVSIITVTCVVEHQTGGLNISVKLIKARPDDGLHFTWYIIGGILILLLPLPYLIHQIGKGHCSACRACYSSRQNITSTNVKDVKKYLKQSRAEACCVFEKKSKTKDTYLIKKNGRSKKTHAFHISHRPRTNFGR
ncbi:uncharacterized protein LOC120985159 isoform X2 [Bufo bufo]|uniref:uncharacterized protein LOC120985159 isoform X2 n=1 Tax=Bufo bufo TaxID=8384 RepID=UPI001ABDFE17|nr:uncharacterized protein LOC120985159 isoform X2 [Bufo bufo]